MAFVEIVCWVWAADLDLDLAMFGARLLVISLCKVVWMGCLLALDFVLDGIGIGRIGFR